LAYDLSNAIHHHTDHQYEFVPNSHHQRDHPYAHVQTSAFSVGLDLCQIRL